MESSKILIIGASARAAAHSAVRAGLLPSCIDLFADLDLQEASQQVETVSLARFPEGLPEISERFAPQNWMYTGGLENAPEVVAAISKRHFLWGVSGDALRDCRDLNQLAPLARQANLPIPKIVADRPLLNDSSDWLIKAKRSVGGLHVRPFSSDLPEPLPPEHYYQQRIQGVSHSAAFVGNGREVRLLGVTRQLSGREFGTPLPFQYAGNIGPLRLERELCSYVETFASLLCQKIKLQGLFGIDFIVDETGQGWFLEVNPRYTSGMEVLEPENNANSLVAWHRSGCLGMDLPKQRLVSEEKVRGKLIIYAPEKGTLPRDWQQRLKCDSSVYWHDLPHAGTSFSSGEPVVTVVVSGENDSLVLQTLFKARAAFTELWQGILI